MANPRHREPQKIGEILTDLIASKGYAQVASHEAYVQAWNAAVGELRNFSRATEVKRGVLHVMVSNSVVMQELTFRKQELLSTISSSLPSIQIKDLRFRVGSIT